MNIIVGLKTREPIPIDYINDLVRNCKSTIHNVEVRLYDYSIVKSEYPISTIHKQFEDFESSSDQILSEMPGESFACIITPNMNILSLDSIEFDLDYGSVYTDYETNGIRIFLKSPPVKNATIPFIFWNTSRTNEFEKDKERSVFSTFISKHIPENLCIIE